MVLKFKDLTRSLSVLSPRRSERRRRSTAATTATAVAEGDVAVGELGQLALQGVASPSSDSRTVSPTTRNGNAHTHSPVNANAHASSSASAPMGRPISPSPSRLPFRIPSSTRNTSKGSYTGSRRSRRKISISIAPDPEGRGGRILRIQRKRKNSVAAATAPVTPLKTPSTPLSRATSWVTLSTRSPCNSPLTLSPRSGKYSTPLELVPATGESSSSSTTIVTPASIVVSPMTLLKGNDNLDPGNHSPASDNATCLLERLFPPAEIERRPSRTRKPAPGRVYVFDVVSEESPVPFVPEKNQSQDQSQNQNQNHDKDQTGQTLDDKKDRTARLAKSAQRAPLSFRFSPWSRIMSDMSFLFSHLGSIPSMFVPCRRHGHGTGHGPSGTPCSSPSGATAIGLEDANSGSPVPPGTTPCRGHITDATLTQGMLFILSLGVTIMGIGSFLACMPTVAALLLLVLLAEHIQGATTRDSKRPDVELVPGVEKEAWFFVNGMTATGDGTQQVIDHLHGLVRRPVTALMNRSLGLWFDFLQSILQRNLFLPTRDLRHNYKYVHEAIMNTSLDRIVIVAHSQGGIIVSAWVDQLIADLHPSLLTRVEVYTFGSAACHFALRADGEGAFARIEHFANMHDLVAQFGVLNYARGGGFAPSRAGAEDGVRAVYGRYVGRVFARNRTGHMLLDHYLHPSDSILDEESVKAASRFAAYVGGGNVLPDLQRNTSASAFATSIKATSVERDTDGNVNTNTKANANAKRDTRCLLGHGSPASSPTKSKK